MYFLENLLVTLLNRGWQVPFCYEQATTTPPDDAVIIGAVRSLQEALKELESDNEEEEMPQKASDSSPQAWLVPKDQEVHISVLGGAGSGKSTFRDNLLAHKIRHGEACVALSQNKDELLQLLSVVATERTAEEVAQKKNLLIIDLEGDYTVSFNRLSGKNPEAQAMQVFTSLGKCWESGVQTSRGQRAVLLTAAKGGLTIGEIELLFSSAELRQKLIPLLGHQERSFWKGLDGLKPSQIPQITAPILNRLDTWLSFAPVRRMLSLPEPLEWRRLFADTPDLVVLINLGVNQFGDAGLMVGTLLFESLLNELMHFSRVRNPEATPVQIVVDEYHGLLTDASVGLLTHALTQSRKYRVSMLLLTQLMALIPSQLRSAIRTNARTSLVFASGSDARDVVDDTNFKTSKITREEARQLIAFQQVGQAVLTRRGKKTLLVQTTPPDPAFEKVDQERIQALYLAGCQTYGIPAAEAEKTIRERQESFLKVVQESATYKVRRRGKEGVG